MIAAHFHTIVLIKMRLAWAGGDLKAALEEIAPGWQEDDDLLALDVMDTIALDAVLAELDACGFHPDRLWPDGRQGAIFAMGAARREHPELTAEAGGVRLAERE